jgi:hypothetical protein
MFITSLLVAGDTCGATSDKGVIGTLSIRVLNTSVAVIPGVGGRPESR